MYIVLSRIGSIRTFLCARVVFINFSRETAMSCGASQATHKPYLSRTTDQKDFLHYNQAAKIVTIKDKQKLRSKPAEGPKITVQDTETLSDRPAAT